MQVNSLSSSSSKSTAITSNFDENLITHLPLEIRAQIFKKLAFSDLPNTLLVNKEWAQLTIDSTRYNKIEFYQKLVFFIKMSLKIQFGKELTHANAVTQRDLILRQNRKKALLEVPAIVPILGVKGINLLASSLILKETARVINENTLDKELKEALTVVIKDLGKTFQQLTEIKKLHEEIAVLKVLETPLKIKGSALNKPLEVKESIKSKKKVANNYQLFFEKIKGKHFEQLQRKQTVRQNATQETVHKDKKAKTAEKNLMAEPSSSQPEKIALSQDQQNLLKLHRAKTLPELIEAEFLFKSGLVEKLDTVISMRLINIPNEDLASLDPSQFRTFYKKYGFILNINECLKVPDFETKKNELLIILDLFLLDTQDFKEALTFVQRYTPRISNDPKEVEEFSFQSFNVIIKHLLFCSQYRKAIEVVYLNQSETNVHRALEILMRLVESSDKLESDYFSYKKKVMSKISTTEDIQLQIFRKDEEKKQLLNTLKQNEEVSKVLKDKKEIADNKKEKENLLKLLKKLDETIGVLIILKEKEVKFKNNQIRFPPELLALIKDAYKQISFRNQIFKFGLPYAELKKN